MIKKGLNLTKCCGVCYNENDIQSIVLFCMSKGLRFYYIKHIGCNDELKNDEHKEHYHFIIESDSQHRFIINSLISESLKENLFQKVDNVHSYLRYMLHIDYIDKEHYNIKDIVSNVDSELIECYINDVVVDKELVNKQNFNILVDCILSRQFHSFRELLLYCRTHNIDYKTSWTSTLFSLINSR